jgi:hypothetical protein
MAPGKKSNNRTYLTEEERNVLSALLEEWTSKPDKKARDAFVSAEALPKIQDLNMAKFGPEIISTDKVAKVLWEQRVQVCIVSLPYLSIPHKLLGSSHLVQKSQTI